MKSSTTKKIMIAALGFMSTGAVCKAEVLHPGQNLLPGRALHSTNGRYHAILQADGNFVVYRNDGAVMWATWTQGSGAVTANMQADGNFVLYAPGVRPVWSTATRGRDRVFTVSDLGQAMVIKVGKWDPSGDVPTLMKRGATYAWVAPQWDSAHLGGGPRGPHCVGDPRACGHAGSSRVKRHGGINWSW
ncbi:hypothetical protein KPL74_13395 [Bacillus sp. NP157]|nr:hypothetical protein KPL74_13395 [Bacillus sp. NP157]